MDNKTIRHFGKNTLNEFLEELKERVVNKLHELEKALPKKLSDLENDLEMATTWDDLENKPFYDTRVFEEIEVEKNLAFDGLENCIEYVQPQEDLEIYFCKISDYVFTTNELLGETIVFNIAGQLHEFVLTEEAIVDMEQNGYPMIQAEGLIIAKEDFDLPGYNIHLTKGTWTQYVGETLGTKHAYLASASLTHVVKETTGNILSGEFKPLDEKFISDSITHMEIYVDEQIDSHTHSYNNLTDRTHYSEITEGINFTWDGKTEWLVTDTHSFTYNGEEKSCIKVSGDIPINKELQHVSGIIRFKEGNTGDHEFNIKISDFIEGNGYIYTSSELLGIESEVVVYLFIITTKEGAKTLGLAKPGIYASYETGNYINGSTISYYFKEINIDTVEDVLRLDERFIPDTISREGHVHSYNDLTDKTHYDTRESEEIIIEWDGDTSDKIVINNNLYKVSDAILTNEQIKNGTITMWDGREIEISPMWSNLVEVGLVTDDFCMFGEAGIVARKDNMTINIGDILSITVEEAGVYFVYASLDDIIVYPTSLKCVQSSGELKQLDEKFIPDSVKSGGTQSDWNQNNENAIDYIKNRPFYTESVNGVEFSFNADQFTDEEMIPGYNKTLQISNFEYSDELEAGNNIVVTFDNEVEYNLQSEILMDVMWCVGDSYMDAASGNIENPTFMIILIPKSNNGFVLFNTNIINFENELKVCIKKEKHHTIDKKYLGDVVGETTKGKTYIINSKEVKGTKSAEIFNDYTNNIATGLYSTAMGTGNTVRGITSFAHGMENNISGGYAAVFGNNNTVRGLNAFASGRWLEANGDCSYAFGNDLIAVSDQFVIGRYNDYEFEYEYTVNTSSYFGCSVPFSGYLYIANEFTVDNKTGVISLVNPELINVDEIEDKSIYVGKYYMDSSCENGVGEHSVHKVTANLVNPEYTGDIYNQYMSQDNMLKNGKYIYMVGNGENENKRSNAHTLDGDGNAWYQGDIYIGGTSQDDTNAKKVATEEYVAELLGVIENGTY